MKKKFPKSVILLCLLLASTFSFYSCTKNSYDKVSTLKLDPAFNIGLISGSVGFSNLNNILSDSNSSLKINSDSTITFYWNGNINTFHTSDFIPAFISTPSIFSLDVINKGILDNAIASPTPYTVTSSQSLNITPQRAQTIDIDTLYLKSGMVQVMINNTFKEPCLITISVPGIISNGAAFSTSLIVKPNTVTIDSFDISNKLIDMSNGGRTTNNLLVNYTISLTKSSGGPEPNGNLTFTQQINHPVMKLMYADVHQQNFFTSKVANIPLNAFKVTQLASNTITFTNDTINLFFSNTFGVPMSFKFTQLQGTDANSHNHYLNVNGITPLKFQISPSPSVGIASYNTLSLNNNNPATFDTLLNIPDFLSTLPTSITPQFSAISNPNSAPKNYNFIQDTSIGKIDAQIIIPLSFKINNFITKDTFDFSLGDLTNVDSLTLRTILNNGLPIGLSANIVFTDANYKTLYTMKSTDISAPLLLLSPANIDPNTLKVNSKAKTQQDFGIKAADVSKLSKASKVIFTGTIISPTKGILPAKIYSNQTVDINIGVKAHYKIN